MPTQTIGAAAGPLLRSGQSAGWDRVDAIILHWCGTHSVDARALPVKALSHNNVVCMNPPCENLMAEREQVYRVTNDGGTTDALFCSIECQREAALGTARR